jgi:transcription elongation factor Elf1
MNPRTPVPTLLTCPATACPRCDDHRIVLFAVDAERSFVWYECEGCEYLWELARKPVGTR